MARLAVMLALAAFAAPEVASAHPRPVPPEELASHWSAPHAVLAAAALALVLFGQAVVRLRRRGRADLAPWSRCALFAAGLVLVALPLVSPLDAVADRYLLSAHMLQHVLIADAGAALLVLAVRGPLALFLLPRAVLRRLATARSAFGLLVRPSVAYALWVAAFGGWHLPSAYDYTLLHPWAHELEHATFVLAGTLAWIQIVDLLRRGRLTRGGRALFAFGMFAFGEAIASGLLLSRAPAYAVYAKQPHRVFGLTPLLDQRLAAAVMFAEQAVTLGAALVVLLWPYLAASTPRVLAARARSG
ncbi:MAG TPA: cytochrome c oxidase assembly protein [Gaiellaceae bacterium]|jgi:cytochrome c oxidase assembly factor CtaG|nr:cytochrome c oxidase assembly protein [Gaiellaceae bacterium]